MSSAMRRPIRIHHDAGGAKQRPKQEKRHEDSLQRKDNHQLNQVLDGAFCAGANRIVSLPHRLNGCMDEVIDPILQTSRLLLLSGGRSGLLHVVSHLFKSPQIPGVACAEELVEQ